MQPFLRESLREMCDSGKWSYAVFWAVCRRNPRLLAWEQYHNASSGLSHVPANLLTPASEEWRQQWLSQEGPFFSTNRKEDVIINKMMINDHIVMVGEGLVGRAAFIGHHQWFVCEDYVRDAHPREVSNDLEYQFSKGIKTVAVIPVLPHGVIRLGSTSIIEEDMEIVKNIKALIHRSRGRAPNSPEVCMKPDALLDDRASNFLKYGVQEIVVTQKTRSYSNQFPSKPTTEFEKPAPPPTSVHSLCGSVDVDVQNREIPSFPTFQDSVSQVHSGNDLHAIFSSFAKRKRSTSENEAASTIVNDNGDDPSAALVCDDDTDSGLFSSTGTDHLLDAVVSGLMVKKKEPSPIISNNTRAYSSQNTCSTITANSIQNGSFLLEKSRDNLGSVVSASLTSGFWEDRGRNIKGAKSQTASWIERGTNLNSESCASTTCYKKTNNSNNRTCRKRLKTGESLKPRPKDRQLIQDRIRELRLIVPFGEKCSIDALLERTIRHMVFLQNVMRYGDTLRRFHCFKTCRKDGEPYTGINFNVEAAVLLEFASRALLGLIIVQDFEEPHLMMAEMICEGTGFLLQISGIIRGLGLKILHGLMEIRGDKTYARFMIETEKNVARIEVFMSLLSVLFPTTKIKDSLFEPHGEFASLMLLI